MLTTSAPSASYLLFDIRTLSPPAPRQPASSSPPCILRSSLTLCSFCSSLCSLLCCLCHLLNLFSLLPGNTCGEAVLFHKGQYGGIKGRSALEAMARALTRAQRALARGGQILWVIEVVKGWFNNVIGQEVLNSVEKSDKQGWYKWLVDFF